MTSIEGDWLAAKTKFLNAQIEDKRGYYKCRKYFTLSEIPTCSEEMQGPWFSWLRFLRLSKPQYAVCEDLNKTVSMFEGHHIFEN